MINYPNIDPVAISIPIPGFWGDALNIHWYGLAYVVGAYLIYLRMVATRDKFGIEASKEDRWGSKFLFDWPDCVTRYNYKLKDAWQRQ